MTHTHTFSGFLLTLPPLLAAQADDTKLDAVTLNATQAPTDLCREPLIIDHAEDVLSRQPGLHVAGQGRRNGQTLSMRGFGSKGVVVNIRKPPRGAS